LSFLGSRKKSVERKISAYEADEATSQLKTEEDKAKKHSGIKARLLCQVQLTVV